MEANNNMQRALTDLQNKMPRTLYDLSYDELLSLISAAGLPKFRAKQILQWLNKGVNTFEEMNNLPKSLFDRLSQNFTPAYPKQIDLKISQLDGSRKYVFELADGNIIEAVYMPYKNANSVCISSQAGCRMGCAFCASTLVKYGRNLSRGEMLGQICKIQRDLRNTRIDHVVVMGIGEPLENLNELIPFLKMLNHEEGLNISLRHVTVSTCGLVPAIYKLAEAKLPITLAISLHSAVQDQRAAIMPIAKHFDLAELKQACSHYFNQTKRRISFEYALFRDFNDSKEAADLLADYIKGLVCHVNLIPANPVPGTAFSAPEPEVIKAFATTLEKRHVEVTIRQKKGQDIWAACGQLRRQKLQS